MGGLQRSFLFGLQILCLLNAVAATDGSSSGNGKWHHPMHKKNPDGGVSTQIIGGSEAAAGAFPWHAWLDLTEIGTSSGYMCGASLIAAKYAMSACHCIMPTTQFQHDIVLGTVNRNTPTAGSIRITIAAPVCHELFNYDTGENDVSLLPFDSPVTPTSNIQWINLPQPSLSSTNLVGTKANVSGFGRISDSTDTTSNTLKYATLSVTSDASCTAEYGQWFVSDVMLCAKAPDADQADCNGDSGGALVYNNGSAWVQIGIVSWGGDFCQNTSSVYARLTSLVGWVTNKMSELDGGVTKTTTTKKPSTTKAPTTPKPPQCAATDFKDLQTKCCSPPAKDLLASSYNTTIETACQNFGVGNSVFNSFVLNKLQDILKNNTVDINDVTTLRKLLGKSICYIECYLTQSGAVDNVGNVNVDKLTALLIANQGPNVVWDDIISLAVSKCTSLITKLPMPEVPSGQFKCDPTGGLIVQCVLGTIIDQCPSKVTTATCKTDYALFDQCKKYLIDLLMNP